MDENLTILPRATLIYDGEDATRALGELREALEAQYGSALVYELVLPGDGSRWIERCLPALADYLVSKKFGVTGGSGVRIALWSGDRVHVLDCESFFGGVGEVLGLAAAPLELRLREAVAARRTSAN